MRYIQPMKKKVMVVLILVQISQLCSAAILKLAGVVPDKGLHVSGSTVTPAKNSEMKVFVSHSKNERWRQLLKSENIPSASVVRVQAP
jgi:hypothetical protein